MEEEEASSDTIVESRKELMILSTDEESPTLRVAHFLKPSVTKNLEESCNLSSFSPPSLPTLDPQKRPWTVKFHGWRYPQKKWNEWVKKMKQLHEPTWTKAGIHEAILNSTYKIRRNNDMILGIAERWCPETKSFIFTWGEASITLEDMMVSGYSVLGCPVFEPLETEELMSIQDKLIKARREVVKSPTKRADHFLWLKMFMGSGSEVEHEAFLSLWLSRFVLPTSYDVISKCILPIAVHLARGTRIALAPAVLAGVYRDLSLLKGKIVALTTLPFVIFSPFQLVQVWVWERFIKLRPNPNLIKDGEPRLAQWNGLKCEFENIRLVLDSSKESFIWRPYTKAVKNWDLPKFYKEKEMWVSINSGLDEELKSFIRCLRVSELVGIEAGCTEHYLPHRVARQFGIDQDVPDFVARPFRNRDDAWSCYNRPIGNVKCYIPSRLCETDVTSQYMEWWRHSVMEMQSARNRVLQQQKTSACFSKKPNLSKEQHKTHKVSSSFNMRRKNCKGKQAVNYSKRLNVLTKKFKKISSFTITPKVSNGRKKFKKISSFTITPKASNGRKEGEMLSSSIKMTPKSAKEKERERSSILKRKNRDDASVALDSCRKKPKTLAESSRKKNKENDNTASKSETFLAEINNLPVPPGFSQKCNRIEAGDSSDDEDNLTIAQLVKSKIKHDVENRHSGNGKNLDGKLQCHSSSVANEEALDDQLQSRSSSFAKKQAVDNSKKLNVLTKKLNKMSSFTITPKVSNGTKEGEMLSSSIKMTSKSAKDKEGDSNNIVLDFHFDCLERSPILKRKNRDDASVALDSLGKKPKTLIKSSRLTNKENDNSASNSEKFLAEINNLQVPPGFSQKCNRIEAGDSSDDEGNLTISQLIKSRNKHDECGNGKNLDGKTQIHSSSVANEEATRTSVLATSVEQALRSEEAVENGQGCQNKNASGQYVIHSSSTDTIVDLTLEEDLKLNESGIEDGQAGNGKNASDPYVLHSSPSDNNEANLTSMESLMFNEAAETRQDRECDQLSHSQSHSSSTADNGALEVLNPETLMENIKPHAAAEKTQVSDGEIAQYQSRSSSVADSETPKTLEVRAISSQNVSSTTSRSNKLDSACGIKEGFSDNASFDSLVLRLENEISRLEKIVADFKAEKSRRN